MNNHQREKKPTGVDGDYYCDTCDNSRYPCDTRILTDLIAELREENLKIDGSNLDPAEKAQQYFDALWVIPYHAEARMRMETDE